MASAMEITSRVIHGRGDERGIRRSVPAKDGPAVRRLRRAMLSAEIVVKESMFCTHLSWQPGEPEFSLPDVGDRLGPFVRIGPRAVS